MIAHIKKIKSIYEFQCSRIVLTIENNFGSGSLELPNYIRAQSKIKEADGTSNPLENIYMTMDKNHKRGIFMNDTLKETMVTDLNDELINKKIRFSTSLFTNHPRKSVEEMKDHLINQLGNFKLVMIPMNPRPGDPEVKYKYKWTGKGSGSNDDLVVCIGLSIIARKFKMVRPPTQLC